MSTVRNPKWRGTVWENFDLDAADQRVRDFVKEVAEREKPLRLSAQTEHERDHAAQGGSYSPTGWGR